MVVLLPKVASSERRFTTSTRYIPPIAKITKYASPYSRGRVNYAFGLGLLLLETADGKQVRELKANSGFLASDQPLLHFGLGDSQTIESLTIRWPSGRTQQFHGLDANALHTITEPSSDEQQDATNRTPPERDIPPDASSQSIDA